MKKHQSRRTFLKSSALATGLIAGTTISSCSNPEEKKTPADFPLFKGANYQAADGVAGLLFSQVGYEPGQPVRVILRLPRKELVSSSPVCKLIPVDNDNAYRVNFKYWGDLWKSHWWIAEFTDIAVSGEWNIQVLSDEQLVFEDQGLKVGSHILWNETVPYSSVDMLERRKHFTKVGAGWQDAGTLWVESPAQSAMIIALTELIEKKADQFDQDFLNRIYTQITIGSEYLVMTQQKATELGYAQGAMSHDLLGHENDILPHDVVKAVIALYRSARFLPEQYQEQKEVYQRSADLSFDWLVNQASPMGDLGMSKRQRGLPREAEIPSDEWMTRELVSLCWASLEKWHNGDENAKQQCLDYAQKVMDRQIPETAAENGYYGHFYEYTSASHSEKSWCHGIVDNKFGADIGGIYPNYLMPLVEMLALWPEHEDAAQWQSTLANFARGYLIPVCDQNPFKIVPLGIFGQEGPIWFAGPFHGTNTIYGYTAALALELARLLDEPELKDIAYSNLQWLAGLNAGITNENLKQAVVYSTDVPAGAALPASMICNIGDRWAGTWFNTRGVICNGFSAGTQFQFDIDPTRENDGPFSFTDEDWIPHSAAWLTGLIRFY
ncbi:MAG: hypothetical protein ACNS62_13005 [Candidatus Cyclobacteriaceae bacterium M3_2C_046]